MEVILPADEILQRIPRLVSTESASAAQFRFISTIATYSYRFNFETADIKNSSRL
jgi:hypothetical protein